MCGRRPRETAIDPASTVVDRGGHPFFLRDHTRAPSLRETLTSQDVSRETYALRLRHTPAGTRDRRRTSPTQSSPTNITSLVYSDHSRSSGSVGPSGPVLPLLSVRPAASRTAGMGHRWVPNPTSLASVTANDSPGASADVRGPRPNWPESKHTISPMLRTVTSCFQAPGADLYMWNTVRTAGRSVEASSTTITTVVRRKSVSRETLGWASFSALAQCVIPVCEFVDRYRRGNK